MLFDGDRPFARPRIAENPPSALEVGLAIGKGLVRLPCENAVIDRLAWRLPPPLPWGGVRPPTGATASVNCRGSSDWCHLCQRCLRHLQVPRFAGIGLALFSLSDELWTTLSPAETSHWLGVGVAPQGGRKKGRTLVAKREVRPSLILLSQRG